MAGKLTKVVSAQWLVVNSKYFKLCNQQFITFY